MNSYTATQVCSFIKLVKSFSQSRPALSLLLQCVSGSLFLAAISQVSITLPFTPIPISMQTLGVFLLIVMQGKTSVGSIALYLAQASVGLPVLAGGKINPFWMVGPTGGYLVGFLLSAYPAAAIYEKKLSWSRAFLTIVLSQVIILSFGMAWLSLFVGLIPAYNMGVAPFWVGTFVKSLMSLAFVFPIEKIRSAFKEIN